MLQELLDGYQYEYVGSMTCDQTCGLGLPFENRGVAKRRADALRSNRENGAVVERHSHSSRRMDGTWADLERPGECTVAAVQHIAPR